MIAKYANNSIVTPADVKPSLEGYKVLGAFNPGAVNLRGEILLAHMSTPSGTGRHGRTQSSGILLGEDFRAVS
jgi:hypothetical protein